MLIITKKGLRMQNKKNVYASNKIFDVLHENIINIKLKPGTLMSEIEISQKLQEDRQNIYLSKSRGLNPRSRLNHQPQC